MAVLSAMVIAMAARNWVEELHVAGAFSDAQAPALNRRIRNRVYAVEQALLRTDRSNPDNALVALLKGQVRIDDPNLGVAGGIDPASAIRGAVRGAIRDFAQAELVAPSTTDQLEEAAVAGAVDAFGYLQTIDQPESKKAISVLAWMIPSYWELPETPPLTNLA